MPVKQPIYRMKYIYASHSLVTKYLYTIFILSLPRKQINNKQSYYIYPVVHQFLTIYTHCVVM